MSKALCRLLRLNKSMLFFEKKDATGYETLDIMLRLAEEIGFQTNSDERYYSFFSGDRYAA